MTFLPIVERELRVASRLRLTHGLRFGLCGAAFLVALIIAVGLWHAPQHMMGRNLFRTIAFIAFCYAVMAGTLHTADCLGSEKREGTLGSLFLTELSRYDTAMGKLVSASLQSLYGVISILPVLALPLLMGGATVREFWCMTLVLIPFFRKMER